jgi:lipoprotein-anchoring transpeptidase ErfK/SrfK|tara:strand:+ start:167 stop:610 length:444 start_codon:yes stop_codon:yes gene_type:complete
MITIDISKQALEYKGKSYSISTAKNGIGEIEDSYCTPTGKFKIAEKIGANLEFGSVLVDRESTGEIYNADLAKQYPDRDWILTRILWLDGVEVHNQNTKNRYIYIHGSPDETPMGMPGSKGCIRMHNYDVIELFESIHTGEDVVIIK